MSSVVLLIISLFAIQVASAQIPRSGIVRDGYEGAELPGVAVLVKGTDTGTVTDLDGRYEINAAAGDVLVFQLDGFCLFEATVGGSQLIDARLKPQCEC
ncbi:MAG: carboxypeptidase-like regulatory domain-containing protein [Gammaproteobacteria bacterium]|nr:carboxypeptidase-like regulatory domain-containing protein [Pseudomonadales bacterium]